MPTSPPLLLSAPSLSPLLSSFLFPLPPTPSLSPLPTPPPSCPLSPPDPSPGLFAQSEGDSLVLGFAPAAIFPCLYISSWGIEADIVLAALLCAFLFEITRYFIGPATTSLGPIVRIAVLAGLAAGTKYNGLLALIVG